MTTGQRHSHDPRHAPNQISDQRFCNAPDCATRLSRYNRRSFCHVHWPTRYPVQRGIEPKPPIAGVRS